MGSGKMPKAMIKKIDRVLESTVDSSTNLSVADLGIVSKLTYQEETKKLFVYKDYAGPRHKCMVCTSMLGMQEVGLMERLQAELESAFPDLTVVISGSAS